MGQTEQPQSGEDHRYCQSRHCCQGKSDERARLEGSDHFESQEVHQHLNRSGDTILALAKTARMVTHRHLSDSGACTGGERGYEAMLLGVQGDPVEQIPTIGLEGTAVI